MFNEELLNISLTLEEIEEILQKRVSIRFGEEWARKLPPCVLAYCPFDNKKYIEHVNLYSASHWGTLQPHVGLDSVETVSHCDHFTLVQPFLFIGKITKGFTTAPGFKPQLPYVNGWALEKGYVKAVVHALPLCEWTGERFEPFHNLFVVSYFSEDAKTARMKIGSEAIDRMTGEVEANTYLMYPRKNKREEHWYDLSYWVERGLLYWVDAEALLNDQPCLRTQDVDAFPYKDLEKLVSK